jgi:hypothetical protein
MLGGRCVLGGSLLPKQACGCLLEGCDQRGGIEPQHEQQADPGRHRHPLTRQRRMPLARSSIRPAKDVEPGPDQRDPREDVRGNHKQARVELVIQTPGHDQVIGHKRQRAGKPQSETVADVPLTGLSFID